jgi:hypothetical protein
LLLAIVFGMNTGSHPKPQQTFLAMSFLAHLLLLSA